MEKPSRKERERKRRREYIIDAAEDVISKEGFDNATMDEIAQKAEVAKGTLYLHFKSKAMVYLAVCERGSSKLNAELAKVITENVTGLKMIERLGHTYLKFVLANPHYFQAFNYYEGLMNDQSTYSSELVTKCRENAQEAMRYIVRALQIGMQDQSIVDRYKPEELGAIIWGASKGIINMAFLNQKGVDHGLMKEAEFELESLIENFIQLISAALLKSK